MNNLVNTYQVNWSSWLYLIVGLIAIYIGLSIIQYIISRYLPYRRSRTQLTQLLSKVKTVFVPIAIFICLLVFVAINPLVHGFIVLIMLAVGYNVGVDYINGVAYTLQHEIKSGDRVWINGQKEEVVQQQALGIMLQSQQGTRFVPYHQIMKSPLTLAAPPKKGIESEFTVLLDDKASIKNTKSAIESILFESPYVDSYQNVEVQMDGLSENRLSVRCRLVTSNERALVQILRDKSYTIELK